jgi:anti-anti-sigma factor
MSSQEPVEVTRSGDAACVRWTVPKMVDSTIIYQVGERLLALLGDKQVQKLDLDLAAVKFLSSAMLDRFVVVHRRASQMGKRMVLQNVRPELREVLSITRLDTLLEIGSEATPHGE